MDNRQRDREYKAGRRASRRLNEVDVEELYFHLPMLKNYVEDVECDTSTRVYLPFVRRLVQIPQRSDV